MDKKFVMGIAAMAALTLVSCSSDDLDSFSDNSSKNEAISFDGYLGRSAVAVNGSRGSVLEKTQLQKSTDGFGVISKYAGGQTSNPDLFSNQKVTYSETESKWKYTPLKFWPAQGNIDFYAYAPFDKNKTINNTSFEFIVDSDVANQKDLLWANAKNQAKTNKPVTFTFNHALSRLGYTVKLSGDYSSDATFTLKKITLAGSDNGTTGAFYKKGTIDLAQANKDANLWSGQTGQQKFDWFSGDYIVNKSTESHPGKVDNGNRDQNEDYLFVIPQDFSKTEGGADKLYVIVTYDIKYNGVTEPITNTVYKQIIKKFEPGKAYMINLTLGLPIEFDADVTTWGDDNSIDCTEPWDR